MTYLEATRFDRISLQGRRGVVSLHSVDVSRYGKLDTWTQCAQRLHQDDLLSAKDLKRVATLDTFGALIGNNDRHFGNLSLYDDYSGPFTLAPVYDMSPMMYAPRENGSLPNSKFKPSGPTPENAAVWSHARDMAEQFWSAMANHPRMELDPTFPSEECLDAVQRLRDPA